MLKALVFAAMALAVAAAPAGAVPRGQQPIRAAPSTPVAAAPLEALNGARLGAGEDIAPEQLGAFVDGVVRAAMAENHIAGVAVSVVQDGKVVLEKGYGFAHFAPAVRVDPETTLFRIGSITKTFTWLAILKAAEARQMALDAPINQYLPKDLQVPPEGFKKPIRVRDLMTHSPGFEDRTLGVLFVRDPARIRPLTAFLSKDRPRRVREPGTVSSYSNYGAALAGEAVAHVEGTSWQDLIEREILTPLNLQHTSVREPYPARQGLPAPMPEALADDVSTGFAWQTGAFAPRKFEYMTSIAPAGVISSSAGDMARYMQLLLNGGTLDGTTVFGPETAQAMRTPMTNLPAGVGNWDAGFAATRLAGRFQAFGHDGGTLSFFSNMILVPSLRVGIFVATNSQGGAKLSEPLPGAIISHFYAPPAPPPAKGTLDPVGAAHVYGGSYLATRRAYGGLEGFVDRFRSLIRVRAARDGALLVRMAGATRRFVPTGEDDVFVPDEGGGPGLQFERKNGRAVRLVTLGFAADRVGPLYQMSTLSIAGMLTLLAAGLAVAGLFFRWGRPVPATRLQLAASLTQIGAAALWLVAACLFAVWATGASDVTKVIYTWPGSLFLAASGAALGAAILSALTLLLLPIVWQRMPRKESWTLWAKSRYSMTVAIFSLLSIVLALWGALTPWSA